MLKKLSLAVLLTTLLASFCALPANAVQINLTVNDSNITVGESFDVNVLLDGEGIQEALLSFGFDVLTSGTYFTYNGYTLGPEVFMDASDPANPLNVAGLLASINDDIQLATLNFTATLPGTESLLAYGTIGPFSGLMYEVSLFDIISGTEITVASSAPVPEPSTMILFSFGLLGLLGGGIRKSVGRVLS